MGGSPAKHVTVVQQPPLQIQPPILSQPGQQQYVPVSVVEPSGRQMLLTVSYTNKTASEISINLPLLPIECGTNVLAHKQTNGDRSVLATDADAARSHTTVVNIRSGVGQAAVGRLLGDTTRTTSGIPGRCRH